MGEHDTGHGLDALIRALRRRAMLAAGVMVCLPLAVGLISLTLPARFEAAAEVLLIDPGTGDPGENADRRAPDAVRTALASQVQVLTSRGVLARVVREHELADAPAFAPTHPPAPGWLARLGISAPAPEREPPPRAVRRRHAVKALRERVTVRREGRSRVARVAVRAASPERAATLANAVAGAYIARRRADRRAARERATKRLAAKVATQREAVREAEDELTAYRREHGLAGEQGAAAAARELQALSSDLARARAELAEARARAARAQRLRDRDEARAAAAVMDDGLMQKLRLRAVELRAEKAELASEYGPRHPKMKTIDKQLAALTGRLDAHAARIVRAQRNEAAVSARRVTELKRAVEAQREALAERRRAVVEAERLERAAATERELLTSFLTRLREAREAHTVQPGARVLARAQPPLNPSSPKRALLAGLAGLAAVPCGLGAVLLAERRETGIANLRDLEAATGTPATVVVPRVSATGKPGTRPLAALHESVTPLVQNLGGDGGHPGRVLITSARPREGKSTLALAYARALAHQAGSVVLVEGDLRQPALASMVRAVETPGVSAALAGTCAVDAAIARDPHSAADLVPAGAGGTPADLLTPAAIRAVLDELAARYTHVVIDAPPVLPVGDAARLVQHAPTVVLAVRWRGTRPGSVRRALASLNADNPNAAGAALTQVDTRHFHHFGHGEDAAHARDTQSYYPA